MEQLNNVVESLTFDFLAKGSYKIQPAKFLEETNALLLDIRSQEEIETISLNLKHHLPVIHIPLNEIPQRLSEIPKDRKVGLFCSSGVRIAMAYLYLRTAGYDNIVMIMGGLDSIVQELKPGKILKKIKSS